MPSFYARRCPACHRPFESNPTFRAAVAYCCNACASGQLCACFVDADLAEDGVDGLTRPFGGEPAGSMLEPRRRMLAGEPMAQVPPRTQAPVEALAGDQ